MRSRYSWLVLIVVAVGLSLASRAPLADADPHPRALEAYGKLPLHFQPNVGQADPRVKFLVREPGYGLFLTPAEAVIVLHRGGFPVSPAASPESGLGRAQRELTQTAVVRMQFVEADAATRLVGLDELPGKVSDLRGSDPARWRRNIPTYARVAYRQLYRGVDLVFYGNQQQLEYDLVVASGTDPDAIVLQFTGAEAVRIDAEGELVLQLGQGELRWRKPVIYQEVEGQRKPVSGGYVLRGPKRVGFRVAAYDASRPLVIDPVLAYSTYLGGTKFEYAGGIAVDAAGSAYIAGTTRSADFPTSNPVQGPSFDGWGFVWDAFVAKLDASGSSLVYATYLGGSDLDAATGIAVDAAGNAYVVGQTYSTDFPTVNALQPVAGGLGDAFVAKLDAAGSTLVYSTYLGGGQRDVGLSIAVDAAGSAYLTGSTESPDFPTVNPLQAALGGSPTCYMDMDGVVHCTFSSVADAFVAKLNADGSALVYSTYLGGTSRDYGHSIAVDGEGNAYVTGITGSIDFPTVNPIQPAHGGGIAEWGAPPLDAFVAKLDAAGSALLYSTYLGGSGNERIARIAVDAAGNAYVAGQTQSEDFPMANAIQPLFGGGWSDAFVTKLDAAGSALVYSTYLGGSSADYALGIAVDGAGTASVVGGTYSTDFPTANPIQAASAGGETCVLGGGCGRDAFITKLNADGSALVYSTYLGGSGDDDAWAIALAGGDTYVLGQTSSKDFPTVNPIQATRAGGLQGDGVSQDVDAFVTKIVPDPM